MDLEINSQARRGGWDSGQFTALLPPSSSLLLSRPAADTEDG